MYTVKRLAPLQEKTFEETEAGSENRDDAIVQAVNLASEEAKENRAKIRATRAYVGYIAFIVESNKKRFGGYAVSIKQD